MELNAFETEDAAASATSFVLSTGLASQSQSFACDPVQSAAPTYLHSVAHDSQAAVAANAVGVPPVDGASSVLSFFPATGAPPMEPLDSSLPPDATAQHAFASHVTAPYGLPAVGEVSALPTMFSSTTNGDAGAYALPGTASALAYCATPGGSIIGMPAATSAASQLYLRGGTELSSAANVAPPVAGTVNPATLTAGLSAPFDATGETALYEVKKCHLHTKPQLTCKFCRKYKSSVHQQARVAQQQEGRWAEMQDLEGAAWAIIELTNTTTYNVNTLLRENILASEYFKSLYGLHTFKEIVDEIFNYADHAEPYCAGSVRAPSTLFCCLYKLFTMRLKEHEVQTLLDHTDSPYLRCAGFLYLRYVLPPDKLWEWVYPYFLDDETFSAGVDKSRTTTIGEYVESLITEDRYFTTVLPRIPVKIKSQDGAQLITMASHRKRKAQNKARLEQFKPGTLVAACSNGEWMEGRVLSIEGADTGQCSCFVRFDDDVVDLIDLGLVIILDAKIRLLKRREERRNKRLARGLPPLVKKRKSRKPGRETTGDGRGMMSSTKESSASPSEHRTGAFANGIPAERHISQDRLHGSQSGENQRYSGDKIRQADNGALSQRHDQRGGTDSRRITADQTVATSRHRRPRSCSASRERPMSGSDTDAKTQHDLMEEFRKRERAKALASGKDYARRPTSYKSSLSLRFETSTGRKRSRSPPVQAIRRDPVVRKTTAPPRDPKEESRKYEPSLAHQQRMAQLVERYSSKGAE